MFRNKVFEFVNRMFNGKVLYADALETTHYAAAAAVLLAEAGVPSVASEMNVRESLSAAPSRISRVSDQESYDRG